LDRHLSAVRAALALGLFVCIATAAPARAATGLVAAYGFDQGSGTVVTDSSGTGNNGSTSGTTWNAAGKFGSALSFNGTNAAVTIPDSNTLDLSTGMTLEAWVNPSTSGGPWRTVVFKQTTSGMVYALYSNNGANRPTGQVNILGEQNALGTAVVPASTWTHLATTYDGATLRLYVNGSQVASKAQTGSIPASTGALRIGGNSVWSEWFAGLIDEVRIYSRALTAGEIQTDMATPIGAPAGDTAPPAVQVTAPPAGTVTGTVSVTASASDNVGVAGVQFQLDGAALGSEDTSAPYSVSWDTTTAASGPHTLTAVARDAAGNRSTSTAVTVTVPSSPTPAFVNDRVIIGLDEPTQLAFAPDGRMLIAERDGTIWVVPAGASEVSPTPFLQIPGVNTQDERGLLGLVLDPQFATNGYVYAYYTSNSPLRNRVARFTALGNAASPASELVIWQNTTPADIWHQGGDLHFGPDGYLYVSVGDHLQSTTAQDLDSYNGKILRMTRDGAVPPGNPFDDGAGPNYDLIWARGLRNPFRFTVDPANGRVIVGDVGQSTTEEVDIAAAGANLGWPICEGACSTPGMTNPIHSYEHSGGDASITGGFVYRGTQFPADHRGDYFFADYAANWIKRLELDGNGNVTGVRNFEPPDGERDGPYGDIVALAEGPDGSLWYVDTGPFENENAGAVRRIRNASGNRPPTAVIAGTPTSGPAPLTVSFSSAGSADPDGQPITYRWAFGDGGTSTQANPSHTFTASGRYAVRLTTSDGTLETVSEPIAITAGSPPVPRILEPTNGATFRAGDVVSFAGDATDGEDGALPPSALNWKIVFHHDSHIHPVLDGVTGSSGSVTIPTTGHSFTGDTSYEIVLTATDGDGIQASRSVTIRPQKVNLTFATAPSGLTVSVDGIPRTAPFTVGEIVGFRYAVDTPSPQAGNTFAAWSDGGAKAHTYTVPASDATLTATFSTPPIGNPVAAYNFNAGSGTTLADVTGKGHTGTLNGPSWSTAGRTGAALSFDGTNDAAAIADANDLDLRTGMTLEAWVRPSALGSWRTVLFKEQASHMTYALYASTRDARPTGQAYIGGERNAQATAGLPVNTWTHLATTYDGATLRLYVNGTQATATALTGAMAVSNGPLKIGGNGIWSEWFAGLIDDVRVYDRALSAAEIQGDMTRAP
jgi:glucose/arabinose dehydrogenase